MQNSNLPTDMRDAIGSAPHDLQACYTSRHMGLHICKESWQDTADPVSLRANEQMG